jgi:hypothetical protein
MAPILYLPSDSGADPQELPAGPANNYSELPAETAAHRYSELPAEVPRPQELEALQVSPMPIQKNFAHIVDGEQVNDVA